MQHKNGSEMSMLFSLEDLLIFVKEGGPGSIPSGNETKLTRRSQSAVSSTGSAQSRCHV